MDSSQQLSQTILYARFLMLNLTSTAFVLHSSPLLNGFHHILHVGFFPLVFFSTNLHCVLNKTDHQHLFMQYLQVSFFFFYSSYRISFFKSILPSMVERLLIFSFIHFLYLNSGNVYVHVCMFLLITI